MTNKNRNKQIHKLFTARKYKKKICIQECNKYLKYTLKMMASKL